MAGRVLTEEDFKDSDKDTSKSDAVPADQKFDQDGKPIVEGPKKETEKVVVKGDKEPLPKLSEEKKYKYASMDEFDKGYREAERKMHEATTQNAELRKKLEQYEKPVAKTPTIDDRIAEISDGAISQINTLKIDYDSDGQPTRESLSKRDRDAALIWAKANRQISRLEIDEERRVSQREQDTVQRTYDRATKEGLKTDAELRLLGYEFSRTDPNLDLDTRIERAVESTKSLLGQVREGFIERQDKDKQEKDELKVLGRGSSRPARTTEKEEKPSTMSQQLADMNESRRLRKDDLY